MKKAPVALMTAENTHCRTHNQSDHSISVVQNNLEAEHVPKIEMI